MFCAFIMGLQVLNLKGIEKLITPLSLTPQGIQDPNKVVEKSSTDSSVFPGALCQAGPPGFRKDSTFLSPFY